MSTRSAPERGTTPERDHERAASADQPRVPAARLPGRRRGRRAGDLRPLVRHVAAQQQEAIESPGAWLTTVASRICLDVLGSARARRERYVGEWIPEPLPGPRGVDQRPARPADPADRVTLDESVSMAFLVVLESMTPAERVAFILHDVFRYPFAEVAEIVGRTPAACRQLASSARRRVRAAQAPGDPGGPAGRHRPGLQAGLGGQGHRGPRRPARPRRHGDRRRRRPASPRCSARSRAASRSPATWPTSPAARPA